MNDNLFGGAARELIQLGGDALCLCADDEVAAMLRRTVAESINANAAARLPVLSWRQLCAAAETLPPDTPPDKVINAAAFLSLSGGRWRMNAAIYAQLTTAQKESGGMRLADALAQLFEEMNEYGVLHNSAADALVAGGVFDNFVYEAKLIDDIRLALAGDSGGGGQRLSAIAAGINKPLLFVCANARPPTPMQQKFINAAGNGKDGKDGSDSSDNKYAKVFCPPPSAEESHLRAALSAKGASIPFDIGIRKCDYYCGLTIADTARAALAAVHSFLASGDNMKIGIVVYDRLLARRLRALAEMDGILIADPSGWRAATLSCGAALASAAMAAARAFDINDADALLHPPFWRSLTSGRHSEMMKEWQTMLDKAKTLPGSWAEVAALSNEGGVLRQAARRLDIGAQQSMTAGEWLGFLRDAFAPLLESYDEDSAAMEMFSRLQTAGGDNQFRAGEFCAWLSVFLHNNEFSGDDIESPIVFIPPHKTGAEFDEVLLLGASAKTLPATSGGIFGERLRAALGLPLRREITERQRDNFCRLIARRERITAIWCDEDGENPQSPFWHLYNKEVQRCGGKTAQLPPPESLTNTAAKDINIPKRAEAVVRYAPHRIGVKEAETLMRCPYRFFTRAILHLRAGDAETELSPVLEGEILHTALQLWAASGGGMKEWQKALSIAISKKHRPRQSISEYHWLANSEALLQWQSARQKEGWQIAAVEEEVKTFLPLPNLPSGGITIRGRMDRRDTCGNKTALIDYKRRRNIRNAAGGEDPQLPLYAYLSGNAGAELIICQPVGKDKGKMKPITANPRRIAARLRATARAASKGAPLPANGAADICKSCEARRICRKDQWQ